MQSPPGLHRRATPTLRAGWTLSMSGSRDLLGLAGQTTSAQVPENQVETTDLQGVPFRRIGLGPAPLYLADGVSLEQAPRVLEAMQLAWQRVPGLLGLPLPTQAVAVLVFRD